MWRGIETILRGRDPREAWLLAQRFCGVCTTVHGMASVRAVEDALGLAIPDNAQFIRNLILIAHALHDHIVHFYHLSSLDWVDITTIPQANAKRASQLGESLSTWTGNSAHALEAVQQRVRGLVSSGQLGIFANGYWGHPAMRLSPEENLLVLAHYFQALDFQRRINQAVAILGGKTPHIQNLAVGGVMNAINRDAQGTINTDRLYAIRAIFDEVTPFVHQVYVPDTVLLAKRYREWFDIGRGVDHYASVADLPVDGKASAFDLPGGLVTDGNISKATAFADWHSTRLRDGVTEDVARAWYTGDAPAHPFDGHTEPAKTPWSEDGKYTWVKAPRYEGAPKQTGPLPDEHEGAVVHVQLGEGVAEVPTTWNASPRDARDVRGPYEASLIGTPLANEHKPLEVLRTVHSFDPCMACACHVLDEHGERLVTVKVL